MDKIEISNSLQTTQEGSIAETEEGGQTMDGKALTLFVGWSTLASGGVDVHFVATAGQLTCIVVADVARAALIWRECGCDVGN